MYAGLSDGRLIIPSLFGYSPGSIVIGLKILFIGEKLSSLKCVRRARKYRVVRQKLTISARHGVLAFTIHVYAQEAPQTWPGEMGNENEISVGGD